MPQPYSLYDADGYVQQDGYCDSEDQVRDLANDLGLHVYLALTTSKFIDPETGGEAPMPAPPEE